MSKRKDFEKWKVEEVYNLQEGCCDKCGKSIQYGYEKHHEDGDNSNNSVENLKLICFACHDAKAYKTYMDKKKKLLKDTQGLIAMGIKGELSGAAMDKLLDSIKLSLSLTEQLYGGRLHKPPIGIRIANQIAIMTLTLKEYERGFKEGMLHASEAMASQMLKLIVATRESTKLIELLSKKVKVKKK